MVILPVILGVGFNYIARGPKVYLQSCPRYLCCHFIYHYDHHGKWAELFTNHRYFFIFFAIMHNTIGYFMGYWGARLSGLNEKIVGQLPLKWACKMEAWPLVLQLKWDVFLA